MTAGAGDRRRAQKMRGLQPYDGTDGTAKTWQDRRRVL